jgi:FMN phosphatase YigB (HAD superfamily)
MMITQANLRPFSKVPETLIALRNGRQRLAVVSNSVHQSNELLQLFERIGINTEFDFCMTSRTAGRVLPDQMALKQVVSELGFCLEETAYLSTNLDRLVIAADTGLLPILLSDTPSTIAERMPGARGQTIHRFCELPALCLATNPKKIAA